MKKGSGEKRKGGTKLKGRQRNQARKETRNHVPMITKGTSDRGGLKKPGDSNTRRVTLRTKRHRRRAWGHLQRGEKRC